jgi:hypothetical protein
MSGDEITLRDVFDLGPIEYSGDRIDPAKVMALGVEIAKKVGARATLANLPGVAQGVLDCVAAALKIRLTEICVEAWNKRDDIRRLDSEAEARNSKPRIVTLAKHTVDWKYRPTVTLSTNGAPLATLEFTAAITLTFDAVTLTVQNGRLLRIATGTGTVGASLHCEKLELVSKKTVPHRLPGTIEFSDGLPLGASRKPIAAIVSAAH